MADKRIILAVVVIVAAVVVAAYVMDDNKGSKNGDEPAVDSRNYEMDIGDTMEFLVFGTFTDDSGRIIDGTATVTLMDLSATQYKTKAEWSVYSVATDGTRTNLGIETTEEWFDKDDSSYTKYSDETLNTFWGEETLEYYVNDDGADWILGKGDVTFAMGMISDNYEIYMELKDCSAFTQKKVQREIHEVALEQKEAVRGSDGSTADVRITTVYSNTVTEIFKQRDITQTVTSDGETKVTEDREWQVLFDDYYDILAKEVEVEHTKEKVDTVWGELEVDAYTVTSSGTSATDYLYGRIAVKSVSSGAWGDIVVETVSIKLDGKEVAPEAVEFFF